MAPVLITILTLTVLGIPLVLKLDRNAPPLRLLGLAFLYGNGVIYFALLALFFLFGVWQIGKKLYDRANAPITRAIERKG